MPAEAMWNGGVDGTNVETRGDLNVPIVSIRGTKGEILQVVNQAVNLPMPKLHTLQQHISVASVGVE